jgi:hypothetical protein
MANLNTHIAGSLYEAFEPEEAKSLWDMFDFVYHGWLNMAEIELNVFTNSTHRIPKDIFPKSLKLLVKVPNSLPIYQTFLKIGFV